MQNINRKCLSCGEWSRNVDHCSNCGLAINPDLIAEEQAKLNPRPKAPELIKLEVIDRFLNYLKTSNFILFRLLYYVLQLVWLVFAGIVSFIVWLTVAAAG